MKGKGFRMSLAIVAVAGWLLLMNGCGTTTGWLMFRQSPRPDRQAPPQEKRQEQKDEVRGYPRIGNNQNVRLDSGEYRGDLRIRANKVTIVGRGTRETTIRGDVIIDGNNVTIRDLTIAGNVTINGNSADLSQARIEGRVLAYSKNSRW